MMIGGVLPAGPLNAIGESPRSDGIVLIHDVYELQNMSLDLNASYALANDIDAGVTKNWNEGKGFNPVGNDTGTFYDNITNYWVYLTTFNGIFDGRYHSIKNLFILQYFRDGIFNISGQSSVGLFGQISSTAQISNVSLTGANITGIKKVGGVVGSSMAGRISGCKYNGSVAGSDCGGIVGSMEYGLVCDCVFSGIIPGPASETGGIAGSNHGGIIANCSSSGSSISDQNGGGLVGINNGDIVNCRADWSLSANTLGGGITATNTGFISNCRASGSVHGGWNKMGGLVGLNHGTVANCTSETTVSGRFCTGGLAGQNPGVISNSSSTGSVTSDGDYTGGLVGANSYFNFMEDPSNQGTIEDCYSTGPVAGTDYVGGLVSFNVDDARIIRCYSTGTVSGSTYLGGLIGYNNGTVVDSYWDRQSSQINTSVGGSGLDTVEMKQKASFSGWDFVNTWKIDEGVSCPRLRVLNGTEPSLFEYPMIFHDNYYTQIMYTSNPVRIQFWAYHADSDDKLSWRINSKYTWLTIDNGTGLVQGLPAKMDVGTSDMATVIVTDSAGRSNSTTFYIWVDQGPPGWVAVPPDTGIDAGDDFDFTVSAGYSDTNHTIVYGISSVPACGIAVDSASGRVLWQNAQSGNYLITITASSGGFTANYAFRLKVNGTPPLPENHSPAWLAVPQARQLTEGDTYRFVLQATDADRNDSIGYGLESPFPSGFTVNATTGELLWQNASLGNHSITATASDGRITLRYQFVLHVQEAAVAPELPPVIVDLTVPTGSSLSQSRELAFSVNASDPNGDNLTYEWRENGRTLSRDRSFSMRFAPGNHTVTLLIGDGAHVTTRTFDFTVTRQPDAVEPGPAVIPANAVAPVVIITTATILSVLALAAGTEVGKYGLLGFLMPLYTRLRREDVLDNETRGMIRGFIMADPGIHFNEIQRRFKLGNGHLAHHLMTLEREGFIKSRADGYLRRFYPADMKIAAQPPRLPKIQRIILETVQESEGLSERDIARVLDMSYSTANRHVNKLAGLGFLRLEKSGMSVRCFIAERGGGSEIRKD